MMTWLQRWEKKGETQKNGDKNQAQTMFENLMRETADADAIS